MKEQILNYLNKIEEHNVQYDNKKNRIIFIKTQGYYQTSFESESIRTFDISDSLYLEVQMDDTFKLFCRVLFYQRFKLLFDGFLSSQNTTLLLNKYTKTRPIG